jgi:hypothetical protein
MAVVGAPAGKIAYQFTLLENYANAWAPFVKTANRYSAGPIGNAGAGNIYAPAWRMLRQGRRAAGMPVGGNVGFVVNFSSPGTGFAVGDTVTFTTHGVTARITGATGGAATAIAILSGGSGLFLSPQEVLVQATTSGAGAGLAITVAPAASGFQYGQPNPQA